MKKLICLFVFISLAVLTGCKSQSEYVYFKPYKPKDYFPKTVEIYEVKEILYPILDSLILRAEACPMYQGLKHKIGFAMNICIDCDSIPSVELSIGAVGVPKYRNHLVLTEAIFQYKDYDFYLDEDFSDEFLIKTGRFTSIPCINPKKYQNWDDFQEYADLWWRYKYIDGQLVNTFSKPCSKEE